MQFQMIDEEATYILARVSKFDSKEYRAFT
jgi:hypothetical protein